MTSIEQKVMGNVALIYTARKLTSRSALEFYAFVLSLAGLAFFVSIPNVFANFTHALFGGNVLSFTIAAVFGTTLFVQLLLAVGVLAAASLAVDLFRFIPRRALGV